MGKIMVRRQTRKQWMAIILCKPNCAETEYTQIFESSSNHYRIADGAVVISKGTAFVERGRHKRRRSAGAGRHGRLGRHSRLVAGVERGGRCVCWWCSRHRRSGRARISWRRIASTRSTTTAAAVAAHTWPKSRCEGRRRHRRRRRGRRPPTTHGATVQRW